MRRFKHHKNIIWGIEESCNKLPRERTAHFKKIGELIAQTDNHHHPIVQSFVVPNDPEGDFPKDGVFPDEYVGDPNIRVITWLHVVERGADLEKMHQEYLQYYKRDGGNFVVLKNETYHHPKNAQLSRRYMWSCAMAGMHTLEAYHNTDKASDAILRDDGRIAQFMEQTDFYTMKPNDELAAGSSRWVLANPGKSYIAYSHDCKGPMGVKGMTAGTYDLMWFDATNGKTIKQADVAASAGEAGWLKPAGLGKEIALYIRRR